MKAMSYISVSKNTITIRCSNETESILQANIVYALNMQYIFNNSLR